MRPRSRLENLTMKHLTEALQLRDAGLTTPWSISTPISAREHARIWGGRASAAAAGVSNLSAGLLDDLRQTAEALAALGDSRCLMATCDTVGDTVSYHYQIYGTIDGNWLSALRRAPGLVCVAVGVVSGTWRLRPRREDYRRICLNLPLRVETQVFWPGVAESGNIPPTSMALLHVTDHVLLRFEAGTRCASGLQVIVSGSHTRNLPPTWPSTRGKS